MKITFEIDDRVLPSIEQYLSTQIRTKIDPDTQAQVHERLYQTVEDLLEDTVGQVVGQCVGMYPPAHLREHIVAQRKAAEALKASARPKRVADAKG